MKPLIGSLAVTAVACAMVPPATGATPPASFAVCAACHRTDDAHGLGPSLKGVFGRVAGTAPGFAYSPAMRRAGGVWNAESLSTFILNPQAAIPGTVMPFGGLPDEKQRAEIVEYLKSLK